MQAKAIQRFVRITPRKCNQVLALIRGQRVEQAQTTLQFRTARFQLLAMFECLPQRVFSPRRPNLLWLFWRLWRGSPLNGDVTWDS